MKIQGVRPIFRIAALLTTVFIAAVITGSFPEMGIFNWPPSATDPMEVLHEFIGVAFILGIGTLIARKQLPKSIWRVALISAFGFLFAQKALLLAADSNEDLMCLSRFELLPPKEAVEERQTYWEWRERHKATYEHYWLRTMNDQELYAFFSFRWSRLSDEKRSQASDFYRSTPRYLFPDLMTGDRSWIFQEVMGDQFPKFENRRGRR